MSELLAEESAIAGGPPASASRLTLASGALAVLISAIWGTNPTALKIALRGFPPIGSAGIRFAIAALGVAAWCRVMRTGLWPRRGEWPWLAGNGALFIAQIATFTMGVYWGTASHSIVLLHTYPLFVVALAHFFVPGDRATWWKLAGLGAAFSGIVSLFAGEWGRWQGTQLLGDATQVVSALLLAVQVVYLKRIVERIDPDRAIFWQMATGAVVFLAYGLGWETLLLQKPGVGPVAAVVYQGLIVGAFCFTVWISLLRRYPASVIAVFGFIGPMVGVVLSTLALPEPFTPALAVSAALVAAGVVLANLGLAARAPAKMARA